MLIFLLKGISYGLMLSIMVGPILFALLQATMERGIKMGTMMGLGVWVSDLLYITTVYLGLSWIEKIATTPNFKFYLGTIGSVVLIAFGIGALLNKTPVEKGENTTKNGVIAHFFKGFFINTFNPFTVFFWIAMGSEVFTSNASNYQAISFFIGIFGIIILTDMIKIVSAKKISKQLKLKHILTFRKIVGVVLIIGGLVLLYRSIFS